jgi:hypothetical protein
LPVMRSPPKASTAHRDASARPVPRIVTFAPGSSVACDFRRRGSGRPVARLSYPPLRGARGAPT